MLNNRTIVCICLPVFLFSLLTEVLSQDESELFVVDGKLWNEAGDTIYGKLLFLNQYYFQFNVTLIDSSGTPLQFFSPKDLNGFVYYIDNESIEYTSMNNPTDLGHLFLRVVYRGKYTMYQFLEINLKSSALTYTVSYFLWDKEWLYPPITMNFEKESLLYHFSDCPELEYKIKSGIYGLPQIKAILTEYEQCKLTDAYEYFFE